ncbi:MAG: S41 family peptidase [Lachnospiraceae bacterium]|nr:S41 family peptidase [Lachnospiraceae bacterium]
MEQWEQQAFAAPEGREEYMQRNHIRRRKRAYIGGLLTGAGATVLLAVVLAVVLLVTGTITVGGAGQETVSENGMLLDEAATLKLDRLAMEIYANYYEDIDEDALIDGVYKGLFSGLGDPYSVYYTPEEYQEIMIDTTANYYGIGAALQQNKNTMEVTITRVYDDSPAYKAGLKAGDRIVMVEDIEAVTMELSELVTHIRGEEGTSVHLQIVRDDEPMEFDVERGEVDIPTVEHRMLDDEIGYIEVVEFAQNTPGYFQQAIEDLQAQGMKKMVIDLRNNGGGLVVACQQMLDMLLPQGVLFYTEDKYGNRQDYTSEGSTYLDIPVAVLVNGYSASASEIFAGAVRDYGYATLIGTTTFGKGIVQNVRQMEDGSAYKITVARYYTPNGDYIHGVGITPDVELEFEYLGDADTDYDELQDNQVLKAMEVLRGEVQ